MYQELPIFRRVIPPKEREGEAEEEEERRREREGREETTHTCPSLTRFLI
jgi:hypothetical protein